VYEFQLHVQCCGKSSTSNVEVKENKVSRKSEVKAQLDMLNVRNQE
jgi:hypothetical protein